MEIALELLKSCSQKGEWLCLKNLHLVVAWLPVLEKELNLLKPHEKFRLWLTTEIHPNFPTILLQGSLKITYEVRIRLIASFKIIKLINFKFILVSAGH